MREISQEFTKKIYSDYQSNIKYKILEDAITHNGLLEMLKTRESTFKIHMFFQ